MCNQKAGNFRYGNFLLFYIYGFTAVYFKFLIGVRYCALRFSCSAR